MGRWRCDRLTARHAAGPLFSYLARMLLLIENADVYAPEHKGRQDVLVANRQIEKVGRVDRHKLEALGVECDVIDATGCVVTPGLIDPHEHLLGCSGEGS